MKRRRVEKFNLRIEAEGCDRKLRPRTLTQRWFGRLLNSSPVSKTSCNKVENPVSLTDTHKPVQSSVPLRRSERSRHPSARVTAALEVEELLCAARNDDSSENRNMPQLEVPPCVELSPPRTPNMIPRLLPHGDDKAPSTATSFASCLYPGHDLPLTPLSSVSNAPSSPRSSITLMLKRAVSVDVLADDSWLTSSLLDLVLARFAKCYSGVSYLSIDFAALASSASSSHAYTDILGSSLSSGHIAKPLIFLCNPSNIHWTLIRVQQSPTPEMQLFEPMGKPQNRNGTLSYRYIPRNVVQWLDACYPLDDDKSWLSVAISAITRQQQVTSFDCGVACLLYAEKCGRMQDKHTINDSTSQEDITNYRKTLQQFVHSIKSSS